MGPLEEQQMLFKYQTLSSSPELILFVFNIFFKYCVPVCVCLHASAHLWHLESNLWELSLPFHCVGSRIRLRLSGLVVSALPC